MKNLRNQPEDWSFLIYVRENVYGKKECQELIKFTTESTMTKRKGKDMEKWMKCYVGTNSLRGSKGIYTLEINTQNGEMREVSTVEADDSAYLYVSEKRKCLYAVMESLEYKGVPGGGVAAYRFHF